MTRSLLVALLALAVLAGCGGDEGDDKAAQEKRERAAAGPPPTGTPEQQIQETWRRYYTALAARNGDGACAQLTDRGRDEVVKESSESGGTCQEVVAVLGSFFKGYRSTLTGIEAKGDRATAVAPRSGQVKAQALELRREDGRWKIDHSGDTD